MHRIISGLLWLRQEPTRRVERTLSLAISLTMLVIPRIRAEFRCPGNVVTIPYHPLGHSLVAIPVQIEQSQPYEFLVDTGSQITVVDPDLAEELHLKPQGSVGFTALSNKSRAIWVRADTVEAGSHVVHSLLIAVKELDQIRSVNPAVRGILGENFLAQFDLLIDYRHKFLCLDANSRMQQEIHGELTPLELGSDDLSDEPLPRPLRIAVHLSGTDRHATILRLDSGANVAILYAASVPPDWMRQAHPPRQGAVIGSASQFFALLPPRDVDIGRHSLWQVVFATPVKQGRVPPSAMDDGLLPMALFQRVFVSYRDRLAILDPR